MQYLDTSVYRGPNVYALFPVIRHTVDLGALEQWPTARLGKGFVEDLVDLLPGLREHGCSYREPGGFIRRMLEDEGTAKRELGAAREDFLRSRAAFAELKRRGALLGRESGSFSIIDTMLDGIDDAVRGD